MNYLANDDLKDNKIRHSSTFCLFTFIFVIFMVSTGQTVVKINKQIAILIKKTSFVKFCHNGTSVDAKKKK